MHGAGFLLAALFLPLSLAAETVVSKGSNAFGEELGPRLIDEFQHKFPDAKVELESKGTATGFAALLAGGCDIAAASRVPSEDELRLARSRWMTDSCRARGRTPAIVWSSTGSYGVDSAG